MFRNTFLAFALVSTAACGDDLTPPSPMPEAGLMDVSPPPAPPTATTTAGEVQGFHGEGYQAFLGIPYAAPPTESRRWAPPQPALPWAGTRDASTKPPSCKQNLLGLGRNSSEDCLFLNVHAPSPLPESAPVMVWFHGGAFIFGEGMQTDGGTAGDILAREHGVIVVSMNYRLGPFGFLAHPALSAEQAGVSGNYGLMDQRMALEWVRDNISSFGGDPNAVTIFGESAGGFSVCAHLLSPQSRGLFHRAISQSGVCGRSLSPQTEAEADGVALAESLGCADSADPLTCLRAKTPEEIAEADSSAGGGIESLLTSRSWWIHHDGVTVPHDFGDAVASGDFADVPSVFGWTKDEGTLFVLLAEQTGITADEARYDSTLLTIAMNEGVDPDLVRAQYPLSAYTDPGAAVAAILGDANLICPSRRATRSIAAAGVEIRAYRFDYPDAGFQLPSSRELGAFHSGEIQFIFGHPSMIGQRSFRGDDEPLNEAMSAYWANFAKGSDAPAGQPSWPDFAAPDFTSLVFDRVIVPADNLNADACALWDTAASATPDAPSGT